MDSIAAAATIGLAVWRLGHLLTLEAGPGDVLVKARRAIGIQHDADGKPEEWHGGLAEGLMCDWCRGVWLAGGLTACWFVFRPAVLALAAAAAALFAGKVWHGQG